MNLRFTVARRVGPVPLGPLRLAVAVLFLAGVALGPLLPPTILAWAGIGVAMMAGAAWSRDGRRLWAGEALWLWPALQLLIHATGDLTSPLLAVLVAWIIVLAAAGTWRWALAGAAVSVALLVTGSAWLGNLALARLTEVVLLAATGIGAAWLIQNTRQRAATERRTLARILNEAQAGADAAPEAAAAGRLEHLEWGLESVRRRLAAERVVIWELEPDDELASAWLASGGQVPGAVALAATPFEWAWQEGLIVRLDAPPAWAPGSAHVWLIRLDGRPDRRQVLSAEFASDEALPVDGALEEEAAFLGTVLRIQGREARAVAAREHLSRVLEVLRRLPRELEPAVLASDLAASAMELAGGTGAAVVRWENDVGRVLVVVGEDGGPPVGTEFGPLESEVALAIRNEAPIVRDRRRTGPGSLPVLARQERWHAEPVAVAAYPLPDAGQGAVGAVVVWDAEHPGLDTGGLAVLEAIVPYAAFQLRHALDYRELRRDAELDSLTGLPNRRVFEQRFRTECARALRYQRPLALIMLDLDAFKDINDTYGHPAGDDVLSAVGQLITAAVRDADMPARYGGEEFAILMPETGLAEAVDAAERLLRLIAARSVPCRDRSIPVRASAGVSAFPACAQEPESLVASADRALYAAKAAGRNRVATAPLAK